LGETNHTPGTPTVTEDPLEGTAYRTIHVLGRGGMGEVVEAEHLPLGRRVVVKLLHPQFADNAPVADRLRVEARSLALVQHPNVVAVSDFGRTRAGRPFLVTERLHGRTLADELHARGHLPVSEAIEIVVQVLAGLEAAHQQGIVHRDVKLANIFLCDPTPTSPRLAKVLDFGLAKLTSSHSLQRTAPEYATKKGTVLGTPRFLAPEQVGRGVVDGRTDVYAAGLVLYTLVAGRGPFAHLRETNAIIKAHLTDTPAPASRYAQQAIPAELDAAILKALAKNQAERFPSASAFADELRRIARTRAHSPPAPTEDDTEETFLMPQAIDDEPDAAAPRLSDDGGKTVIVAQPRREDLAPERAEPRGLSLRTLVLVTLGTALTLLGLIMLAARHVR
jgi:serine/threonine-protein kinase